MNGRRISLFKTYFDEIEEINGDNEYRAWLSKVFEAKVELGVFIAIYWGKGRATKYVGFLKGSFNFSFYFNQNITIPIPYVYNWGFTMESPQQFGLFIIIDYVKGALLLTVLKQPMKNDQEDMVLNPSINNLLMFACIGAISKDGNMWSVTKRLLTYNMNELAIARFIAWHRFLQLVLKYCIDDIGPFIPFCDDLQPSNMLIDLKTLQIIVIFDFEFINAMPAQFTYDPPWWLLLSGPEALELVEGGLVPMGKQLTKPYLSIWMCNSWRSGRFWFDYAARKSFELDAIY
ncbi:hypothetical protein BGZ63DRAFT_416070 [Mariannaea sp. PMI_226]|nr:hypothetical protein BGZ63DRAFT_416070 [Mariannaea sp. PMI_226]